MSEIRLLPSVMDDTAQAAQWYDEGRGPHAGSPRGVLVRTCRLRGALSGGLLFLPSHIQEHGRIYKTVYSDSRRILLNPFPYAVYYRYHEDSVVVSLVIHTARSPQLLRKLLKERRLRS
jgi:hypothetical protein